MKRSGEITITYYRRRRVRKRRTQSVRGCPLCGSSSDMITVAAAVQLMGVGRSTLYRWVANQQVYAVKPIGGQLCICHGCLANRVATSASGHSAKRSPGQAREIKELGEN